jgi:L-lactate dehydrogenase complex protein LldE
MLRTQYPRLAEADSALHRDVEAMVPRVFEFCEFLAGELNVHDVGAYFPHRVTYHASCSALRALRLGGAPVDLLRAVRGLDFVELPRVEECCGFGGTFSIRNAETSTAMLTDKMRAILDTGAEIVAAADNSCLMHIGGGLSRARAGVGAMHVAEILAQTDAPA